MHRLNTYPLIHASMAHALLNLVALAPLLERFEREVGTLKSTLLVSGPLCTFPAGLYLALEVGVFRGSQAVFGSRFVLRVDSPPQVHFPVLTGERARL